MAIPGNKREKIEKFGHIIAGVIILLHSYEKFEEHSNAYLIFGLLGLIFLCIALFHHKLTRLHPYTDSIFSIIEAISVFVIAVEYFHEEKNGLAVCYSFASVMYLIAAVIRYKKNKLKAN